MANVHRRASSSPGAVRVFKYLPIRIPIGSESRSQFRRKRRGLGMRRSIAGHRSQPRHGAERDGPRLTGIGTRGLGPDTGFSGSFQGTPACEGPHEFGSWLGAELQNRLTRNQPRPNHGNHN